MIDAPAHRPPVSPVLIAALGVLAVSLIVTSYGVTSLQVYSPDPFTLGICAQQLLGGGALYDAAWQDKPPLALLAYAVTQLIAPGSYLALQICFGLFLSTMGLVAAWRARSTAAKVLCVAIIALLPLSDIDLLWPSTEHLSNLFVGLALALALYDRQRPDGNTWVAVAAGVCVVCAFHTRQTSVLVGIVYPAVILASRMSRRQTLARIAGFIVGGLLAWAANIALVVMIGDIRGYFETVFLYPARYSDVGSLASVGKLLLESARTPIPAITTLLLATAWRTRDRWFAVGLVFLGLLSCALPQRSYPHYIASMLPFLVALVWICDEHGDKVAGSLRVISFTAVTVGLLTAALTIERIVESPSARWLDEVVDMVDQVGEPEDTLWVAGPKIGTYIQFTSSLEPSHTYSAAFQLDPPWNEMLPAPRRSIMADYLESPPDVLVVYDEVVRSVSTQKAVLAPDQIKSSRQLVGALLATNRYRNNGVVNGFVVFSLQRPQ